MGEASGLTTWPCGRSARARIWALLTVDYDNATVSTSIDISSVRAVDVPRVRDTPAAAERPQAPAASVPATAWLANPYPRLDPALDLVVLAFHDSEGRVTRTLPSAAVLQAYRLHGVPGRTSPAA